MKKLLNNQKGAVPVLLLLAALGLLLYLFATNTFSFKDKLFNTLFPKPPSHAVEQAPSVPDEILIKFKAGVPDQAKDNVLKEHGLELKETIPGIEVALAKVPEQAKDKVLEALSKNPNIEYAEPNFLAEAQLTTNDYYFTYQWPLTRISAPSGWDISTGDPAVKVAVLDTGVDIDHEEWIDHFISDPRYDLTTLDDTYGHGTMVAGVVGALTNNGKGVASVGFNVTPLIIKIASGGSTGDYSIAQGIITAADNGAKSINISWGGYSYSQTMQSAANYAWDRGAMVVAASGNDGSTNPFFPAALGNVVAVGGVNSLDKNSTYTSCYNGVCTERFVFNYGYWLDVVAPASSVFTTKMGGSYTAAGGTSLASPHVAALAGLIFSANPALKNKEVVDIILNSADDLGDPGKDDYYGYGRINVFKALSLAKNTQPQTPDTTPPILTITSPKNGETVSKVFEVTTDVSDNGRIKEVVFNIGYRCYCRVVIDQTAPYSTIFDISAYINDYSLGTQSITATAYDEWGNHASQTIYVNVVDTSSPSPTPTPTPTPNSTPEPSPTPTPTPAPTSSPSDTTPPAVSISNPTNGSILKANSTAYIQASALDNIKVSKVEFYVNKSLKCTSAVSPYTCSWKVPGRKNASYTLSAKAYDTSNNTSSSSITVKAQ